MTKEDRDYLIETLEYGLHKCIDANGDSQTHFNSFANALEIVKNCSMPDVVGKSEQFYCTIKGQGKQKEQCKHQCGECKPLYPQ